MSSNKPTGVLIDLLQKQMKLEEGHSSLAEYINAATTCIAASKRLEPYVKLEKAYGVDTSYRDPIATTRERLLEINDELKHLAIGKKVWGDRDSEWSSSLPYGVGGGAADCV